jgi:WD40 repeat protein
MDSSGTRMISGSIDYILKIWDLSKMTKKLKAVREFKAFDGHPITKLAFNPNGESFLCCTTNSSARIYHKDG